MAPPSDRSFKVLISRAMTFREVARQKTLSMPSRSRRSSRRLGSRVNDGEGLLGGVFKSMHRGPISSAAIADPCHTEIGELSRGRSIRNNQNVDRQRRHFTKFPDK